MAPTTRAEQRERTRRELIAVSRRLFAERGYADVGLAEIVAAAGVTKGALYHHFATKADLFAAVLAEVQQEVGARVAAAADARDDPWEQLLAGCDAFLDASADPQAQRVMLVDGPAVLGWAVWRELDAAASARHLREALAALVDGGVLRPQPVEPLTHLLSGAMNEAALWLAAAGPARDLAATKRVLAELLAGLRADAPPGER